MTHLKQGDPAPDFTATDQNGNTVSLKDFRGTRVVLYFYPKDNTPGCTAEACSLRDHHESLLNSGYRVLGVSPDSAKSHLSFISKYQLPFTLIADTDKEVAKAYGVWGPKKFMGRVYDGVHRTTFLISAEGTIEKILTEVNTKEHAAQILG